MIKNCNDCKFWRQIKGHFRKCGLNKNMECNYFMEDGTEERKAVRGRMGNAGGSGRIRVSNSAVQRFW